MDVSTTQLRTGFTLLEVVLVIVILGILSVITFEFFTGAVKIYNVARADNSLYQMGRNALWRIIRDTRSAVNAELSGNELILSNIKPTPLDDATGVRYILDGNILLRSREGGASPTRNPIADRVSTAEFEVEPGFIRIDLKFKNSSDARLEFITGVAVRNYSTRFQGDWNELADPEKYFNNSSGNAEKEQKGQTG